MRIENKRNPNKTHEWAQQRACVYDKNELRQIPPLLQLRQLTKSTNRGSSQVKRQKNTAGHLVDRSAIFEYNLPAVAHLPSGWLRPALWEHP